MDVLIRIIALARPHRWALLGAYLCALAVIGLNLVVPWVVKVVIDEGLVGGSPSYFLWAALLILGLALVKSVFAFGQTYLTEAVAQRIAYQLRNRLYDHIQRLHFGFHNTAQTGQLISQATADVDAIRQFSGQGLMQIVSTVVLFVGTLLTLFTLHWQLALVSSAVLPLIGVVAVWFGRTARPRFLRVRDQFGRVTTVIQENLVGVRVVKAFAREPYEIEKLTREDQELLTLNLAAIRLWAFAFPFMVFLSALGTALLLYYGGHETIRGRLSVGTLVAFHGYLAQLAPSVRRLGFIVNMVARAVAAGQRIFELLDTPPQITTPPTAIRPGRLEGRVRFERVSFAYQKGRLVLRDIDFSVEPGQVIGLVGPTGAGKTTLVNLIPRFYDPTSGRVLVDGYDVRDLDLTDLRRQVSFVLQDTFLFSATIRDNIAYARPDAPFEEIVRAAKAARAHDFIVRFPQGYDTPVGERGVTLSGGQKQRIAIARALLADPRILILDDATSSVDLETEYLIQQALAELMRGRTTFIIAQRLVSVKGADLILVLENGQIVERGTHQDLLALNGRYAEVYRLQLKDQEDSARLLVGPRPAR